MELGHNSYGKNTHNGERKVDPIFIPLIGCQVSGVGVQDMRLCLSFLTPET